MQTVIDYELIDHGIDNSQYFQGCGTDYTSFDYVATGIGDTPADAIDDCLEQIAQRANGWDCEELQARILEDEGWDEFPTTPSVAEEFPMEDEENPLDCDCETYYHVSIRWN